MCLYLDNKLLVELDKRAFIGLVFNKTGCGNCRECMEYLIIRKFK